MSPPAGTASHAGRERRHVSDVGGGARESGIRPLAFLAVTLIALAVVPIFVGQRVAEVDEEIARILEPGRRVGSDLALLLARQMYRFQSYLLTGEGRFREQYVEGREEERVLYERLLQLADGMDLSVRERLAALYAAASRWHLIHQSVLADEDARQAYVADLGEERERYDDVLAAARALEGTLALEIRAGRRRMERARALQTLLTGVLVALALGGTVAIAVVARRLRGLVHASQRRQQEAVRARREVDAILEATGDGVLSLDLKGRVTALNRAGVELLGYQRGEARGAHVHDLLHGGLDPASSHERDACPLLAAFAGGRDGDALGEEMVRRDGTTFPARWSVRPMTDGRRVRGAVVTFGDMTEIRDAEDALRRAVAARDEMLGVVSHDLRNPVGTVGAAAELLIDLDLPDEARREQLDVIRRTAERMGRLIEDLLDVTRIDGGGLALDVEAQAAATLVHETVDQHRILARERGVELLADTTADPGPVCADRERILQALANLVGNALKFTPRGGRVTVRSAPNGGERVVIAVEDTGEGIAPENIERLFDRFWQQRRAGRQGAGLGLAIARGIVEAHGAELRVDSEPGRGSTFSFALERAGPRAGAPASAGAGATGRET